MKNFPYSIKFLLLIIQVLVVFTSTFAQNPTKTDLTKSTPSTSTPTPTISNQVRGVPGIKKVREARQPEMNLYTGVSSNILKKDATEINFVNSLNSFWIALNTYDGSIDATRITNRVRYTRADHVLRVAHGFSRSARWDMGVDFYYNANRIDDEARNSPFKVFKKPGIGSTYVSNRGLTAIGLQARFTPFKYIPELTIRVGGSFPMLKTAEQRLKMNAQRSQIFVTGTFFQRLGPKTLYYLQADLRSQVANAENRTGTFSPSLSGYLVFQAVGKEWFVFPGLIYNINLLKYQSSARFSRAGEQLLGSIGVMYQPSSRWGIYLTGQTPFVFESGSEQNIWVRRSFIGFNLGARFLFQP
jgi:surface antigen